MVDSYDGANDPNWSPDGKRLVFGKVLPLKDDDSVYVLDLQTREISKLPGSEGMYSPRWSRDGHFILAMRQDSRKLLLLELTTQEWKTLSEGRLQSYPTWSQDSQYIYFSSPFEPNTPFYRVRIRDNLLEKVTDAKVARNLAAGVFGMWTGLDPGDSPMILRYTSLQEIYALDWQLP